MIVGGFAVGLHGHERPTKDIDIVLQLPFTERDQVKDLIDSLGITDPVEQVDPQWGKRLSTELPSGLKLEVFFAPDHPWYKEEFARAHKIELAGRDIPVLSPENLILRKLVNTRLRRGQDMIDAVAVAKVQGDQLDIDYLRANCAIHRVCAKLEQALEEAGLASDP